ncbi:Uncharacterised protein [Shigella sonnei]|nr:Uncharacterised protein [Shigella sonnei]CST36059.1 Uncharacterised protein [Shigella sonnei]
MFTVVDTGKQKRGESYSLNSRENICGIVKFVSVTNILVICHSKWSANLLI